MQAQQRRTADTSSLPGPDDTQRVVLSNGITVLVRENFASPAVVVQGYLQVGAEDEPTGRYGLAGFTADAMQRGTLKRSFDELYEEVESVGATFGLATGSHISSFAAKGLADALPDLLDILSDVLRFPAFDAHQVEKARTEILTDLQERSNDTRRMARLRFYEMAYPATHPYHWSQMGYSDTVEAISRNDLAAFHQQFFVPVGMVIVIVGGIQSDKAVDAVREAFSDWQGNRSPRTSPLTAPPLQEKLEQHTALEDKTESSIVLGWPGPPRRHADFIPCFIGNTVLGVFGMYGRLGQRVREENGLAYYVYSRLTGGTGPGPWYIVGGFGQADVKQGVDLILDELCALRETPIPAEELDDTLSYLAGSLPLYLETNEGVARSLINIERYGLGLGYLRQYQAMIQAVTAEQVQAAVCRWVDLNHYALAVAEPAQNPER